MNGFEKVFCAVTREEFDFLIKDYGFRLGSFSETPGPYYHCFVKYESNKLTVELFWNAHDGFDVTIVVKIDTFWIRPASSHRYSIREILRVADCQPAAQCTPPFHENEQSLRNVLNFYAQQLKGRCEPLLKGDMAICENALIERYCNNVKSISMAEYQKIFSEECANLGPHDAEQIEAALASNNRFEIHSVLEKLLHARKVVTPRFLQTLHNFWLQHFS